MLKQVFLSLYVSLLIPTIILTSDTNKDVSESTESLDLAEQNSQTNPQAQVSGPEGTIFSGIPIDDNLESQSPNYSSQYPNPFAQSRFDNNFVLDMSEIDLEKARFERIQKRNQADQEQLEKTVSEDPTSTIEQQTDSKTPRKNSILSNNRYNFRKIKQKFLDNAYDSAILCDRPINLNLTNEEIRHIKTTLNQQEKELLMNLWIEKYRDIFYVNKIKPIASVNSTIMQIFNLIAQFMLIPEEKKQINAMISKTTPEQDLKTLLQQYKELEQKHKMLSYQLETLTAKLIKQYTTYFKTTSTPEINSLKQIKTTKLNDLKKIQAILESLQQHVIQIEQERLGKFHQSALELSKKFSRFASPQEILFLIKASDGNNENKIPLSKFILFDLTNFNPSASFQEECLKLQNNFKIKLPIQDIQVKIIENYAQRLFDIGFEPQKPIQDQEHLFKTVNIDWQSATDAFKEMLLYALIVQPQ